MSSVCKRLCLWNTESESQDNKELASFLRGSIGSHREAVRPRRSVERQKGGGWDSVHRSRQHRTPAMARWQKEGREPRKIYKKGERRLMVLPTDIPRALPSLGCSWGFVNQSWIEDPWIEKGSVLFPEAELDLRTACFPAHISVMFAYPTSQHTGKTPWLVNVVYKPREHGRVYLAPGGKAKSGSSRYQVQRAAWL